MQDNKSANQREELNEFITQFKERKLEQITPTEIKCIKKLESVTIQGKKEVSPMYKTKMELIISDSNPQQEIRICFNALRKLKMLEELFIVVIFENNSQNDEMKQYSIDLGNVKTLKKLSISFQGSQNVTILNHIRNLLDLKSLTIISRIHPFYDKTNTTNEPLPIQFSNSLIMNVFKCQYLDTLSLDLPSLIQLDDNCINELSSIQNLKQLVNLKINLKNNNLSGNYLLSSCEALFEQISKLTSLKKFELVDAREKTEYENQEYEIERIFKNLSTSLSLTQVQLKMGNQLFRIKEDETQNLQPSSKYIRSAIQEIRKIQNLESLQFLVRDEDSAKSLTDLSCFSDSQVRFMKFEFVQFTNIFCIAPIISMQSLRVLEIGLLAPNFISQSLLKQYSLLLAKMTQLIYLSIPNFIQSRSVKLKKLPNLVILKITK